MKYRLPLFLITFFAISHILANSAYAYIDITKNQLELVADFTLDHKANAGGALTQNYFVFPDTSGSHGLPGAIKVVDRNTCQLTDTVYINKEVYLSGLYNKWGTNYITLIGSGQQKGCYKLNGSKLQKSSGCPTPPGRSLTYQKTGQGNTTVFNNHVFKVAGYNGGIIGVWNNSGTRLATYRVPESVLSYEPENISIDGETGEAYINYAKSVNGKRHSLWYKLDSSVLSAYTGKNGRSNPTRCENSTATAGGGYYTDPTSNPDDYYDEDKTEVRDETRKPNSAVSAYDKSIDTNFFGDIQDDGKGCGTYMVMNTIIDILSTGIVIAAVIGVTISGLTYVNAKDDVQKTTKAKRRIYEIVIGLVAYAVLYATLEFLLPGGNLNPNNACSEAPESSNAVSGWQPNSKTTPIDTPTAQSNLPSDNGATSNNSTSTAAQKLLSAAEKYSNLIVQNKLKYCNKKPYYTWKNVLSKKCLNCTDYVTIAAREAGLIKSGSGGIWAGSGKLHGESKLNKSKVKVQQNINKTIASLYKNKKLVPGDIVGAGTGEVNHMMIFKEYKNGKYYFYSVNSKCNGKSTKTTVFKKSCISQRTYSGTWKVGVIIHPL